MVITVEAGIRGASIPAFAAAVKKHYRRKSGCLTRPLRRSDMRPGQSYPDAGARYSGTGSGPQQRLLPLRSRRGTAMIAFIEGNIKIA